MASSCSTAEPLPSLRFFEKQSDYVGSYRSHSHDDWELVLLLEGVVEDVRGPKKLRIDPSSLVGMPPGENHTPRILQRARWFEIRIQDEWMDRHKGCSEFIQSSSVLKQGAAVAIARRMHHEYLVGDSLAPLMMEGLLIELMVESARTVGCASLPGLPGWLRRAQAFMQDNSSQLLGLDAIAQIANVHPAHLVREFRRYFRCTPCDYLRGIRVDKAKHMLAATDLALCEIALEVGFSHQSHFCRVFKSRVGLSPGEYRRNCGTGAVLEQ